MTKKTREGTMSMETRDTFIFYRSFAEAARDLPDADRLTLYDAITSYALDGMEPELGGIALTLWKLVKPQLAANNKRFKDGKKGGEYGVQGGRPPKEKTPSGLPKETLEGIPQETPEGFLPETPNNNNNLNNNENNNHNEDEIDFSNDPQKLFIHIWQHTPGIFNAFGRIESPNEWDRFWATAPPTCDEVRTVMQNVIDDVRDGRQDPHFIAKTPDRFVLGGGFVRHKKRRKPDKKNSPPPSLAGKISLGDILDD